MRDVRSRGWRIFARLPTDRFLLPVRDETGSECPDGTIGPR